LRGAQRLLLAQQKKFGTEEKSNSRYGKLETSPYERYKSSYEYASHGSTIFENLVDKKQLAKLMSLSVSYIDKMMAQEGLPHFKIGRAVRYRFSEVTAFLERRKRP
jgi:excisionase family DNA binding protein